MNKHFIYKISAILMIVMLAVAALPSPQALAHPILPSQRGAATEAAIAVGTAWTNVYHNAAAPGAAAASFAVAAGSNRMLVVALSYELSGNNSLTLGTGVSYGGVAMTAASANDTSFASMHSLIYFLRDNAVMDGTGKTLAVGITSSNYVMQNIWYAVFTGVDQNGTPASQNYSSGSSTVTSAAFSSGLPINAGDQAVLVATAARNSNPVTYTAPATFTPIGNNQPDGNTGLGLVASRNTTASGTDTANFTAITSGTRWSQTAIILNPFSTATTAGTATAIAAGPTSITVSMPYIGDGNNNNSYTVDYKLHTDVSWTNLVTNAAHVASPYTTTITGLNASSSYDVRMTYNDADGVTGSPQTVTVSTSAWPNGVTSTWVAPAGVTSVIVEVWGGGGKGSDLTSNGNGGGGGGGAYSKATLSVTPGNSYSVVQGAGATTTAAGGNSSFSFSSTTLVLARGGDSVANNTAAGAAGGAAASGTGDVKYSGGAGATGTGTYGGGGGSSAGTTADGTAATTATGAIAPTGGGNGGAGRSGSQGDGTDGTVPGGGGGGAYRTSFIRSGGNGGNGKVVLTYGASNKLVITSVNGGSNPIISTPFSVDVQAQNSGGTPISVSTTTLVTLTRTTGTGTVGGTFTGTINSGNNSITISGVTYSVAESGVVLTATASGGDTLAAGNSAPFTVNSGIVKPSLSAPTATAFTSGTATLGDSVTSDGGAALTERGFCAGTASAPTYCVAVPGTSLGPFSMLWDGLTPATFFYYRGYAKNSMGTGYSTDGTFYTKPSLQASGVNFTSVTASSMTVNWTNPGPNAIVLMKASSAVNSDPVDLTSYTANAAFGSGTQIGTGNYAVYSGPGASVNVTGLTLGTTYYVAVYTYAGSGTSSVFNTTSPATGNQATIPTWINSGSFTWTAPAHVTSVTVQVWGGGGKGADLTSNGGGGGGGGGAYSRKSDIPVWPGTTYTAVIGGGSTSDTTPGGDSYFINSATVLAKGGGSATANSSNGAVGGSGSAGVGDAKYSGGSGANGATTSGGGGGASAGTTMAGMGGSGSTGGTGLAGGGNGGNGTTGTQGNGTAGSLPGGGGGGAYRTSSGSFTGGNGADGKVIITYVLTTDTSLAVSCTPTSIEEGYWTSCKATVTRSSGTANITGRVDWVVSSADTGTFTTSPCTLSGSGSTASCTVHYTADNIGTGAHVIQATYGGDGNYGRSTASTTETVVADVAPLIATDGISYRTNSGYVQLDEDDSVPQTSDQMRIKVTFNKDVYNVSSTDPDWSDSVTNPDNYRLFFVQSNFSVKTTSCTSDANTFDHILTIDSVTYSNGSGGTGPFVATLTFNPYTGTDASFNNDQNYRLFVCGKTSITDLDGVTLAGDGSTEGTDFIRNFTVLGPNLPSIAPVIPATGFAPNRVTVLPRQPADKAYAALGPVWLYIPKLGVESNIIGVPQLNGTWDVAWLNNDIGWLAGSAYPSLSGNSVLTGHYFNSNGAAGPFRYLGQLSVGDQIIVRSYGVSYVYQVRSLQQVDPGKVDAMLKHEDKPWLTLVTCVDYLANNNFKYRLIVRAEYVGSK